MQFRSDSIKSEARFMVTSDSATIQSFFVSVGGYFYDKWVFIPFSSTVNDYTHS